jgi:sensor histidine kinase YesM
VKYFGYRSEKSELLKSSILFMAIFIIDCMGSFWITNEMVFVVGFIMSSFLFSMAFLNGRLFEKILVSAVSYTLIYFVNLPVLNIISIISKISATDLTVAQNSSRIICLFCTKLLYFIATQCILCFRKKEQYRFRINEWIVVISAFLITLLIGFTMYIITVQNKLTDYACLAVTFLLSALDIIIFIFIHKMNISSQKEAEKEHLKLLIQQQQNEMQNLEQLYNKMSILRHDYNNKIICVHTLLSQNEYSDAKNYVANLLGNSLNEVKSHIQCSSSVINAVVNEKFSIAEKHNIETSCRIVVAIPKYLEYDLSVLLANLLDNAIEACEKNSIPSQIILTITDAAGYYKVVLKNTLQTSVLKENSRLESNKAEKEKHGWGLKSIREITEKYYGTMDIYEKDCEFIASVMLMKQQTPTWGI